MFEVNSLSYGAFIIWVLSLSIQILVNTKKLNRIEKELKIKRRKK
jgi:hypothetical protein